LIALLANPFLKAGVIIAFMGAIWAHGYVSGIDHGKKQQLAATVAAYQKRDNIDATVSKLDDFSACLELGGLPEQCNELRGLVPPPKG
jgi:hypothetical protein